MASLLVTRGAVGVAPFAIDDAQPDGGAGDGSVGVGPDDPGLDSAAAAVGLVAEPPEPSPPAAIPIAGGATQSRLHPEAGVVTSASVRATSAGWVTDGADAILPPLGFETVPDTTANGTSGAAAPGIGGFYPTTAAAAPAATGPSGIGGGKSDVAIPATGARLAPSPTFSIVDIIPFVDSAETGQNSEPSLAVNPLNPSQIIAGSFSLSGTPFYLSTNAGATWADFANLSTEDKTLAWLLDGSSFLAARLNTSGNIDTFSATTKSSGFGASISTIGSSGNLDQPWIRTGPASHVYLAYNNLNNFSTTRETASVAVSTNGGSTFTQNVIERVPAGSGQDAPAVRLAVNGNTIYAAFTRWVSFLDIDAASETRYASQVVVVRSDNGGADGFTALGASGVGAVVGSPIGLFANTENAPLTLGQERTSSDMAIAVDPNNASHLLVAYSNAPGTTGSGQLQLIVAESSDGGATWNTKFTTSSAVRTAQPALAILGSGTIGFLYDSYTPSVTNPNSNGTLTQHFLETTDDFGTNTVDTVLASETNTTPSFQFGPYIGDFFDLEGIGSTFYGIFSASNQDDGLNAVFPTSPIFQRATKGTEGTGTFQVTTTGGTAVAFSIDPYFFTASDIACFCRGTRILTERGEAPVEDLKIGDTVVTLSGALRPIKWIGRRAYDARFVAGNRKILPVRITAGALGPGLPARDLWVSPEHALYLDGALAAARLLVDGTTIVQAERVHALEYFHVELDAHDIILAEGVPAESYVECDNRTMFANAAEFARLYPADRGRPAKFCAPRLAPGAAALAPMCAALAAAA